MRSFANGHADGMSRRTEQHVVAAHRLRRHDVAAAPHDAASSAREAAAVDKMLDRLVHDLYGLTDDEITLVEESTPTPEEGSRACPSCP